MNSFGINKALASFTKALENNDIINLGDTGISIHYKVDGNPKNECGSLGMRHESHYTLVSSDGIVIGDEPIMTGSYYASPNGNTDYINEHNLKVQKGEVRGICNAAPSFLMKRIKEIDKAVEQIKGKATKDKIDDLQRYAAECGAITKIISSVVSYEDEPIPNQKTLDAIKEGNEILKNGSARFSSSKEMWAKLDKEIKR